MVPFIWFEFGLLLFWVFSSLYAWSRMLIFDYFLGEIVEKTKKRKIISENHIT